MRMRSTRVFPIAGVDEAGRGPLAGPVVAAAVMLDPGKPIAGLADSKLLTATDRESLAAEIFHKAHGFGIGEASVAEIDELNILHASMLAMTRAVAELAACAGLRPELILVDGNRCPPLTAAGRAIVRGDGKVAAIAAASIIAKVVRDKTMCELESDYPHYGFAQHKGYPTAAHKRALLEHGVSAVHRQSFAPVRSVLAATASNR